MVIQKNTLHNTTEELAPFRYKHFNLPHVSLTFVMSRTAYGYFLLFCFATLGFAQEPDASQMAKRIDELILAKIHAAGSEPAPVAGDSEFLRRAALDLTGVIPRVSRTRAFLKDPSREALIEELLASPRHATHLAVTWRNILLTDGNAGIANAGSLEFWLRDRFVENLRYDRLVDEFLVATGEANSGPAVFYTLHERSPEKLAASTARIFLGLQLECAQCHDHPADHWSQKDFWGYAAFFARLKPAGETMAMNSTLTDLPTGEVTIPDSNETVPPKYPDGPLANPKDGGTRRSQLAIWMASRDNPYLARAAVNRIWAQLLGRGLVEPVDDIGSHNAASHPELLNELAEYFVASGFDMKAVYHAIALSKTYQRTSRGETDLPPELFAQAAVRKLTPEQVYDSIQRARHAVATDDNAMRGSRQIFLARMRSLSPSQTNYDAGIPQALTLLNGGEMTAASNAETSSLLKAIQAPYFTDEERIETLFLASLSRLPTEPQRQQIAEMISRAEDKKEALAELFWALLNSAEFGLNH